jgi:hypothetical protein
MNNTSPTKSRGRTQVHRNGKQFLAALLAHRRVTLITKRLCHQRGKGGIVITKKGNISMIICDTDLPQRLTKS